MKEPDSLPGLNDKQREAVEWCDGHQLVVAGAGSGKTKVLTAKAAYLVTEGIARPEDITAVTFTNKAAREMLERVNRMAGGGLNGMRVSTFHSWGLRFLQRNRNALRDIGYGGNFVVFDRGDCKNIIKKIAKQLGFDDYKASELMDKVSRAYADCDPATLEPKIDERFRRIYSAYRAALQERDALDFDDLMILPLYLLLNNKWLLAEERDSKDPGGVKWILVDEYQDVNRPQHMLLKLLAGSKNRVMAVGDPDQSIYGWRGADVSLIMNFRHDFRPSRVFILDQNYRSTGNILAAANAVIGENAERYEKDLITDSGKGYPVKFVKFRDFKDEVNFVANEIENLVVSQAERDYGDICVLYRINAMSRAYGDKFFDRRIPYAVVRGAAFYERQEVKDVLAFLRLSVNPRDETSLERVGNVPARGLGKKSISKIAGMLKEADGRAGEIWRALADGSIPVKGREAAGAVKLGAAMAELCEALNVRDAIDFILRGIGYDDWLLKEHPDDYTERLENVLELISIAPEEGSIADALAEVAIYTDQETAEEGPKVTLMTLHAAKGLEFPVVFMVGMEDGIFPTSRSIEEDENVEEERRLCYVGMTRARERLYLSGATFRKLSGQERISSYSRFTDELLSNAAEGTVKVDERKSGKFFWSS